MNIDGKYLPFNQMTLEVFQSRMLLASSTPKFEGVMMNTNAFFVNKSAHKYPGFGSNSPNNAEKYYCTKFVHKCGVQNNLEFGYEK